MSANTYKCIYKHKQTFIPRYHKYCVRLLMSRLIERMRVGTVCSQALHKTIEAAMMGTLHVPFPPADLTAANVIISERKIKPFDSPGGIKDRCPLLVNTVCTTPFQIAENHPSRLVSICTIINFLYCSASEGLSAQNKTESTNLSSVLPPGLQTCR